MASSLAPTRRTVRKVRRSGAGEAPRTTLATVALAVLLLLTLTGPATQDFTHVFGIGANVLRQSGYLLLFAASIVAARPLQHPERLLVVPWPVLPALGWCWLSIGWSVAPDASLRGLVLTTIVTWSAFLLVRQLGYERTLLVLRVALGAMVVANVAVALVNPDLGYHPAGESEELAGGLRGFLGHKNAMGLVAALTVIVFAFDHRALPRFAGWIAAAAAAAVLVMTRSKTSMGLCAVALPLGFLFLWGAPRLQYGLSRMAAGGRLALSALWAVPALLFVYWTANIAIPLSWVSDPEAFTGRGAIWQPMMRAYSANPWLGYGFNAFWSTGDARPLLGFTDDKWVIDVSEGHNGFLDLLVQVGLPGLLLILVAVVVWPLSRLVRDADRSGGAGALAATLVFFCVGHNLTETSLFTRDQTAHVVLMLAMAMLWRITSAASGQQRPRQPATAAPRPVRRPTRG
jgi:exopolysaccharide production protein ExoQ